MKVLEVTGRSSGGIIRHIRLLCELLTETGSEVALAQPVENGTLGVAGVPETPIAISSRPSLQDRATIRTLRALAPDFDVLHAHGLRAGALCGLALRGSPVGQRPRLVVTLHNQVPSSGLMRLIGDYLLNTICQQADVVLGVSSDLVELARSRGARDAQRALIPAEPAAVTGKPRDEIRSDLGLTTSLCFVTVARLAPQKGLEMLIETARRMSFTDYTWFVAGDGPLRGALEQAAGGTPVSFLGARADIGDLLRAADVVVSTSVWEGQSIFLQEALKAGRPLVATAVGGNPEVTGEAAVLVSPDASALAAALDEVSGDAQLRERLQMDALARAAELPTPQQMLAQIQEVLKG